MCNTEIFRALGKGRRMLQLEVCSSSRQRQGAIPGKGGAEGKAAEVCGSSDGAEEAEGFRGTLELRC